MDSLDLDIGNYTIKDIEKFFQLKPKIKYSSADIEQKEYQLREQLLMSGHVNKRFKRDLLEFLTLAKDWLIFVKCPPNKAPSIIPKNHQLDTLNTPLSKVPSSRADDVIVRPETQFINAQGSDFFPGSMNPLSTRIITKCLNIDTRFRDNIHTTQSSDFLLQLPSKFNKVVSMQLAALELPVSFYGISSSYGNNFLRLVVNYTSIPNDTTATDYSGVTVAQNDDGTFTATRTIFVPDGNYAAIDLISNINLQLGPVQVVNNTLLLYPNNIFSYVQLYLGISVNGSGSGKVTISSRPTNDTNYGYSGSVQFINLDFTLDSHGVTDYVDINSKLGWNLGYQKRQYFGMKSITGETIIEPTNVRYVYLVIDDYNNNVNNHFVGAFNKSVLSPNILARISLKSASFSILMENDFNIVSEPRRYFGPVDIQKMKIQLVDEYGKVLQMNNSDFSFCLNLKMLYDL